MEEQVQGRSKSTACRRPFVPIFCEYYFSKEDAIRREDYFKTSAGKRKLMLRESLKKLKKYKVEFDFIMDVFYLFQEG